MSTHLTHERQAVRSFANSKEATIAGGQRSAVGPATIIPRPPGWGPRVVHQMPLEFVSQCLFKNELFRQSWGAKKAHGEEWVRLSAEFEARLQRMQRQALREGWLQPQALYG